MQITSWALVLLVLVTPLVFASPAALGAGRMPANTRVAGVNVSGMRPQDARRAVSETISSEITVSLLDEDHQFAPADIGIIYDLDAVLDNAMAVRQGGTYDLTVRLDSTQFQTHLTQLQQYIPNAAQNATVVVTEQGATVTPAVIGQMFDAEVYRLAVIGHALDPEPHIAINVELAQPDITTEEAQATADTVNGMLQEPLVLSHADQTWTISPRELSAAVVVLPNGQGELTVGWDLDMLHPPIDRIVTEIESTGVKDAWVQDLGTHSWLVPEQGGATVDRKKLFENINATLAIGDRQVRIPVVIAPAQKTTEDVMADLGITGLVGRGDSVYSGSGTGRAHNVETAVYYINRTLVEPGGTYSFNESVGSLFTGEYMSAGSYIDGPSGESIAGGVCQVSTTVFRAVLNAGFPIEERWPHTYRSPFYELGGWSPGYDAAIVQDSVVPQDSTDMRFTNTTDSWLLITATADGERLVVEIWGPDTGYSVEFSQPEIWVAYSAPTEAIVMIDDQLPAGTLTVQDPLDGLGVSITRWVYDRNGELVRSDTWQTTYYATGPIVRASPDMEYEAYAMSGG